MRTFLVLLFCLSLALISCESDSDDTPTGDFLEITVNGKTYRHVSNGGPAFSGQGGCDDKTYLTTLLDQIEAPALFLNVYIKHYGNDTDFKASQPGKYGMTEIDGYDVSALVEGCNLSLGVSYADKQQTDDQTTLLPGSIHNVTNIKEIERANSDIGYFISGTFSCSFKNSVGQIIPVTGRYQTKIYALK